MDIIAFEEFGDRIEINHREKRSGDEIRKNLVCGNNVILSGVGTGQEGENVDFRLGEGAPDTLKQEGGLLFDGREVVVPDIVASTEDEDVTDLFPLGEWRPRGHVHDRGEVVPQLAASN